MKVLLICSLYGVAGGGRMILPSILLMDWFLRDIPHWSLQKTVMLLPGNFYIVSRAENIILDESRYH